MFARRTVVLCCDFQNDIVNALPPELRAQVVRNAQLALSAARTAGIPIIHVGVCFRPGYPEVNDDNRQFKGIKGSRMLVDGMQGSQFIPEMAPLPSEPVVVKKRLGAQFETELPGLLRSLNAATVVLMGVATSGVVLSTVRWLSDSDYLITILEDCCADKDALTHQVLCNKVFPKQAAVATCAEFSVQVQ